MVCVRGVPGVTGTLGEANSHFDPTQTGRGPHHHVEAAVDWCSSILLAFHVHTIQGGPRVGLQLLNLFIIS